MIDIKPLSKLYDISKNEKYVCIRLSGLLGDAIHASTKFNYILDEYPDHKWIIIHSYPIKGNIHSKVKLVADNMLCSWIKEGRIIHYFYDGSGHGGQHGDTIPAIQKARKFLGDDIPFIDGMCTTCRYPNMTRPLLGIDIPKEKNPRKAVILRKSAWHNHCPKRNRTYMEWYRIEQELLKFGYEVTIVGVDDTFPNKNRLIDLRNKLSIREVLEYSKDASICITPETFLYVWTQFICPTLVLADPNDVNNLNTNWKLNDNMKTFSCDTLKYMDDLFKSIHRVKHGELI